MIASLQGAIRPDLPAHYFRHRLVRCRHRLAQVDGFAPLTLANLDYMFAGPTVSVLSVQGCGRLWHKDPLRPQLEPRGLRHTCWLFLLGPLAGFGCSFVVLLRPLAGAMLCGSRAPLFSFCVFVCAVCAPGVTQSPQDGRIN